MQTCWDYTTYFYYWIEYILVYSLINPHISHKSYFFKLKKKFLMPASFSYHMPRFAKKKLNIYKLIIGKNLSVP